MILRQRAGALLLSLFLPFIALVAAQDPSHVITSFQNLPARLFFFEDTTTAVYFDSIEGNVYISLDEGKSWNVADGIPKGEAMMVIEHPFDNQYAFVLTKGTRHYRTDDRGKTWRSFDMPARPSLVARPLSFHSDPKNYGYILYQGTVCDRIGWGAVCHDETFYTKGAFGDEPKLLLKETSRCQFAHSSKEFKHAAHSDLIYCVAYDTSSDSGTHHALSSSLLFSSTDFFQNEKRVEDLGIGKNAKGVFAFATVSKFAVVALKDMSPNSDGGVLLYVTVDTESWAKAHFPHASSAKLRENAYTIVESTTHSLGVDVVLHDQSTIGTLFVSNSNGTFFVQSLQDTNRNEMGYVDFEKLYGVDGVGIANVVANADEVEARGAEKLLKTVITFDDGSSWQSLQAPLTDANGQRVSCNPSDDDCTLHLHSVTTPHNFGRIFSSPAPGLVMGVGSIGKTLLPYEECDTFLSTDAGLTWKMVRNDAHKYEFGDSGSIVIAVNDEDGTESLAYSLDLGNTWRTYNFGARMRARALTTVPDSTSQKFLMVGQVSRKDQTNNIGRYVVVFLDFVETRSRQCNDNDFERWYARAGKSDCLMGHKQWYRRRKPDANCYVGGKFKDPEEHEENCPCTDVDYECDFNFIRNGNECVPVGPEPIEAGVCPTPLSKYMGSSGWRKIPGNTCTGGNKDAKVEKDCANAQPKEGEVSHQTFEFPSVVVQHAYFKESTTILVRLHDNSIWQSSNEGYVWNQIHPEERFLAFYHHPHSPDRAYLITSGSAFYATTDSGRSWNKFSTPNPPNTFRAQVLRFQPDADRLIWIGNEDCDKLFGNCRAEAHYSRNNGRTWSKVEEYVVNCAWATDTKLNADPTEIICESYQKKEGSQRLFQNDNPLELIEGQGFYSRKKKLFNQVVGFAKFSEFLVVAELVPSGRALDLQVSLDGVHFATGMFPPTMHPETHAYTVLESSTGSLFIHMTMSEPPSPYWGNILKSNSNGTYFVLSVENVNRDDRGYVDFEKMIGLDGIALINIVSNPEEAAVSGRKTIQSRITHNDGSTWKPLTPPMVDSQGNKYACDHAGCALHVHGYTERTDPRATYSSPSIVGLIMAVGNVGESLLPYTESDTFLSRDGGFTWKEVHKDAHLWEFGDSGSILIMANDEAPTDHVLFSTDEGDNWREYRFSNEKIRIRTIVTVPMDTSRKFILMGQYPTKTSQSVVVQIDFSALTSKQCVLNVEEPGNDDFELWSPSEDRSELCLFGRLTLYHRRVKDKNCVVGKQPKAEARIERNCTCTEVDFECEFNYIRNADNECVLVPGTTPLPNEEKCSNDEEFWYERTAYRKIPYSSCDGGQRPDQGAAHPCPGFKSKSATFWWFVIMIPFAFTALVGYWYYRRSGLARGTIRLPTDRGYSGFRTDSGILDTLASVPWFVVGLAGVAWEWVASHVDQYTRSFGSRRGYRNIPVDEDAQILRFEDEE